MTRADRWRRRRRWSAVRGAAWDRRLPSPGSLVEDPLHAPALETAGDDQPLDLAGSLPDAVDTKLAEQPLGHVRPQIPAATEGLDAAVGATPGRLAREQLRHRRLVVDDLRVRAGIRQRGDGQCQQTPRGG